MRRAGLMVLAGTLAWAGTALADPAMTVTASGWSAMASEADSDAARRRALGEALVAAALAGGAELQGYTAAAQARIVADLTVLRATAQVLSHRVIAARREGDGWSVSIEAQVAPLDAGQCGGGRMLALSVAPPAVTVAPEVPGWAAALAERLAGELIATAAAHPRVAFDGVLPAGGAAGAVPAAMDYTALTRGVPAAGAGAHRLTLSLRLGPARGAGATALALQATLTIDGPDGQRMQREVATAARLPRGEALDLLAGRSRDRAAADLAAGLAETLDTMLETAGCSAPAAIVALAGDGLSVPIGRRHGLSRTSLGVVAGGAPGLGLLEVVTLQGDRATLRPLDPAVPASAFAGARVQFVEAGS